MKRLGHSRRGVPGAVLTDPMERRALILGLGAISCGGAVPPKAASELETTPKNPRPGSSPQGTLRLASGTWSPFTDVPEKPRLAIEIVQEALKRAGHKAESTIVHPQELMDALKKGTFDGSEALWLTEDRLEYMFYSRPYLENRLILLARFGEKVSAERTEDIQGKKLGVVKGYAYGPEVLDAIGPKFIEGDSDSDNLRALLNGSLDYIIVDELLAYYMFRYEPEKASKLLVAGEIPMTTRSLHFAVHKKVPGAEKIIEDFNQQVDKMVRDGTYNDILKVEWLVTDVDRDGRPEYVIRGTEAGSAPPQAGYKVVGTNHKGAPRFIVGGEAYDDWDSVPQQYKVAAGPAPEPLDTFVPGVNLVLAEF
jgi:polar amino acid transport system substrate-binding protein